MRYRLGEFKTQSGSNDFAWMFDEPETAEPMRLALEEMLHVRLSSSMDTATTDHQGNPAPLPDLLPKMTPWHPDASWVHAIHRRLGELSHTLDIRLLACEYEPGPDGFLCIAATSPSVAGEVVPGDEVQAGFAAMRDRDRPVRISQRIFRLVCSNGSIVSIHDDEESTANEVDLETTTSRCFDRSRFEASLQVLQEAARDGNVNPRHMLDEMGHINVDPSILRVVMERWWKRRAAQHREDPSLWDFLNYLTEVARDLPDWRDRLDLEEAAGRLALLRAPRPRKTPGEALTLA